MSAAEAGKGRGRFRYGLQPVLDLRQWQFDALKADAMAAARFLAERERELAVVESGMAGCHERLTRARAQGATLDMDQEWAVRDHLARLSQRMEACVAQRDEARRVHEQVSLSLRRAHQALKGMEKHQAGRKQAHAAALACAQALEADEAWLLASGGRKVMA